MLYLAYIKKLESIMKKKKEKSKLKQNILKVL